MSEMEGGAICPDLVAGGDASCWNQRSLSEDDKPLIVACLMEATPHHDITDGGTAGGGAGGGGTRR